MFFGRKPEIERLESITESREAEFLHIRGRRRIGKTYLLKALQKRRPECILFTGKKEITSAQHIEAFVKIWLEVDPHSDLAHFRRNALSWRLFFRTILQWTQTQQRSVVLIFDEIQWIAKTRSGFSSELKEAWVEFEQSQRVSIIISGSSHKFFENNTDESKVLRGLRTRGDLWVHPFQLKEVHEYYFPSCSYEEVALVYMMVGGVPYYLDQFRRHHDDNLLKVINRVFFTSESIFFDELDEILDLEFNGNAKEKVKVILAHLGQTGKTIANIEKTSQLAESTIRATINKLIDYRIVQPLTPFGRSKKTHEVGTRYVMKDFFLNTYFQILMPQRNKALRNKEGAQFRNIFANEIINGSHFYIPNFSGHAFELLVEQTLLLAQSTSTEIPMLNRMAYGLDFTLGNYWQDGTTQIDLIIDSKENREQLMLEIKWVGDTVTKEKDHWINELMDKAYVAKNKGLRRAFLVSTNYSEGFKEAACRQKIALFTVNDLF